MTWFQLVSSDKNCYVILSFLFVYGECSFHWNNNSNTNSTPAIAPTPVTRGIVLGKPWVRGKARNGGWIMVPIRDEAQQLGV